MFFRGLLLNPSPSTDGISFNKANYTKVMNQYLCRVKHLTRSKVDFLYLLQNSLCSPSLALKKKESYWVAKTFEKWSADLGLSNQEINSIVTSLRQENLIQTQRLANHPAIRINNDTINDEQLWKILPESKDLFPSPLIGEAA